MTMQGTESAIGPQSRLEVATMETPEDVDAMLRLHAAGWGTKRIALELGCARNTVKRYLEEGGWKPYASGNRSKRLDDHQEWVREAFAQHGGNAEVVRQELVREHQVEVSLRTVERAVEEQRRTLRAEARATVRYETPPGQQLQVDFGELYVEIGGQREKVHLCVVTLGWSRRLYVRAFANERQTNWFTGLEGAFAQFGGVPAEVLVDNARALVAHHDPLTREVRFNERFAQFAVYWGFRPRACAPYRPRTKGKDERTVGYVKRNAIAGRTFASWEELDAWLAKWTREVADVRVHGTTGERPIDRGEREQQALQPLGKPPFVAERELRRRVSHEGAVEFGRCWYSVPWTLGGADVTVHIVGRQLTVKHGGKEVARHTVADGWRKRVVDKDHLVGVARGPEPESATPPPQRPEFERSLDDYAAVVDGVAA
jgi:transposase